MTEDEMIKGIQRQGKYDVIVESGSEALRIVGVALPHASQLPPAQAGQPYPLPQKGVKAWFQVHPAEPNAGNDLPHVKYEDWTRGKKGRGGSWGHISFPAGS